LEHSDPSMATRLRYEAKQDAASRKVQIEAEIKHLIEQRDRCSSRIEQLKNELDPLLSRTERLARSRHLVVY
jgi:uncharacterized coiled-coil DUF342 family protein